MHSGLNYSLREVFFWTRRDLFKFFIIALIPVLLYEWAGWKWLSVPWLPIASIGTAVAFIIAFKNNASYDRTWEARKIWGAIVNSSRSWAIMVLDFVNNDHAAEKLSPEALHEIHSRMFYRHFAWLTAMRYQLRAPRNWEQSRLNRSDVEYRKKFDVPEYLSQMDAALKTFLSPQEHNDICGKNNRATQLIKWQSHELKVLKQQGYIEDFRHMEMIQVLSALYEQQGKCERIKNFPYPRQYATLNKYFIWLFIVLVPLGMMKEFAGMGPYLIWLTVPFSVIVSWVFHTMERIGDASENPFAGSPNDIPISALSRTIEINLREMLNEKEIPPPLEPKNNILM